MAVNTNREPWLAVLWSRVWPGLGQIYGGAKVRGVVIGLGFLGLAIASLLGALGLAGLPAQAWVFVGLSMLPFSLWSWFDAYWVTRKRNAPEFEAERRAKKDPWLAVFWTTLFLGAGHLYIRRYVLGGILIAVGVVGFVIPFAWLLLPLVAIHAYGATPDVDESRQTSQQTGEILLVAWFFPILLSAALAFGLRTFVAEARFIPSGAMEPTLKVQDRLVIDKLTYQFQPPQRGDIVVFNPTEELQRQSFTDAFIKRIIGLPGETVEVKQGKVFVDGELLDEPYSLEAPSYDWTAPQLNIPEVIPPEHYFVLGDNRNNSYDSSFWGYVPRGKIVGRATQRFWPVERMGAIE